MDLDQLLHETAHVDVGAPPAWAPPSVRRRLVTPLRASVAAAVAAAALIAPTLSLGGVSHPAASADAAEVLHQAAVAAGAQPDGDWRSAPYWYSKSTYTRGGQTFTREIWIGHHKVGVLRDPGVDGNGRVEPLDVATFDDGGGWDSLWTLPTDPGELARHFRQAGKGQGNDPDSELFTWVGDYLRESPAPPRLRAALYEVAAGIPGVRLIGTVTDHAGRTGTAVERDGQRLTFSTTDGRLLEETEGDPSAPDEVYYDAEGKVVGSGSRGFASTYLDQHASATAPAYDPAFKVNGDGSVTDTSVAGATP